MSAEVDALDAKQDSASKLGVQLTEMRREVESLRTQLAAQMLELAQTQADLALRNAALDASGTHFMIVDACLPKQPIVYVNRALAKAHGYGSPGELIGQRVGTITRQLHPSEKRELMLRQLTEGQVVVMDGEMTRVDGSKFSVGFTTTPLKNEYGLTTHFVTFGADITCKLERDRKERELQEKLYAEMRERERMAIELRLAQKLESVGRLAAGLAHEINTPIQYVGDSVHFVQSAFTDVAQVLAEYRSAVAELADKDGFGALARRMHDVEVALDFEFLSEEAPRALVRALDGADRVATIVRAMKEFAYPDGAVHSPADINRALLTTLTVASNEYKYAASVVKELAEVPMVVCNVGELNQVFLNLIVNAAHAIQDSGKDANSGRITVATRQMDDVVEISIADNGCGIPQENLDKIFDPFYTTKEVGRGTGQGLAITRSIVCDRHGGQVDVISSVGHGTTFIIRLPVQGKVKAS